MYNQSAVPQNNTQVVERISSDAGEVARSKLESKCNLTVTRVFNYFSLIVFSLSALIVGALYYHWETRTISGYHYERTCTLPEDSGIQITGTRKYFNVAETFLGFRLIDADKAQENTTLKSTNVATTVVGINGDEWWSVHNPAAEPRYINLEAAEKYIFMQNGKTFVTNYNQFCK